MNKFTGFPIKKKVFLIDSISNMLVNIFHNQRQMFFLFCCKYVDIVEQLGNLLGHQDLLVCQCKYENLSITHCQYLQIKFHVGTTCNFFCKAIMKFARKIIKFWEMRKWDWNWREMKSGRDKVYSLNFNGHNDNQYDHSYQKFSTPIKFPIHWSIILSL